MSKHSDTLYRVKDDAPTWLKLAFGELGIPQDFDEEKLTKEQHEHLQTLETIIHLVKEGRVEPIIRSGKVHYRKVC